MSMFIEAAKFASERHSGQTRKGTGRPYTDHLFRVAGQFAAHAEANETGVAVALLHDTLEDTKTETAEIVQLFGIDVANGVILLTKPKDDRPRAERNAEYFKRLKNRAPHYIKIIKLIDRLDNLGETQNMPSDFIRRYCEESILLLLDIGDADKNLQREINDRCSVLLNG